MGREGDLRERKCHVDESEYEKLPKVLPSDREELRLQRHDLHLLQTRVLLDVHAPLE